MKKAFSHTKVAVKLRKSPYAEAWFIYLEAYPVYDYEGAKPKRVREYLNRTITTPVWTRTSLQEVKVTASNTICQSVM